MSGSAAKSEGDSSLWKTIRGLLFGDASEPTLREQIEEVIDEADGDAGPSAAGDDLATVERQMLRNMLRFGERTVDDVAVPRRDIIAISDEASFEQAIALFADADHSRLPVYRGQSLDEVVGMLHVKDLFGIIARGEAPPKSLSSLLREPLYVPQSMGAMELLVEMRAKRTHLAIVLDEYGGTDGLVTIEDLVEEIVGEIEDEHDDAPEELLVAEGDDSWIGDARIELDELAARLDPLFRSVDDDVDTLGGLAFVLAGHVPQPGETLVHAGRWRIDILEGDERRVTKVRLVRQPAAEGEAADVA